jgi:N-glycosylase/DNA lyase
MEYNGYNVSQKKDGVIVYGIKDFEPKHVFECGQCFRWIKENDNSYTGIVKKKVINVSKTGDDLIIKNTNFEDFKNIWFEYFDLGRDYGKIKSQLKKYKYMNEAIKFGHGIRLLKQDFDEMLISFIISANNRIPMIMKTIERLSMLAGEEIELYGKKYYRFPNIKNISNLGISKIQSTRMGFRAKYVYDTAQKIAGGQANLGILNFIDTDEARKELMKFNGVGNKVADCVLLFSGLKYDVFPVDVWVKRVMQELYIKKETNIKEIDNYATQYFGDLKGFAQQYLFYYAKEMKIGKK